MASTLCQKHACLFAALQQLLVKIRLPLQASQHFPCQICLLACCKVKADSKYRGSHSELNSTNLFLFCCRFMVNANGSDWMGRYIIKREYSEGANNIFDLTLPQLGPISTSSDDMQLHQGHYSADVVPSAPMRSHADPPHAGIPECSSDQTHTSQQLGFVLSFAKAAASKLAHLSSFLFHSAPSSISAKPGTCQAEAEVQSLGGQSSNFGPTIDTGIGPDLAGHNTADSISCSTGERPPKNGSWVYPGLQLPAELKNLLAETADKLLHHSCGEGWLVQPRIANMSHLEYRVYLLGGASAVSARVFPFSHKYHSWLRMDVYVNVQHAFQYTLQCIPAQNGTP